MKAVIVDIKEKQAAALLNDGSFVNIKNDHYTIGQVVHLNKDTASLGRRTAAIAAAVAAVVCISGGVAYAYTDPYSYVSLDVNPSIAFQVNRFDQVIGVQGMDSDGVTVLSHLDLKNKNIREAVTQALGEIQTEGFFLGSDENGVVISTCGGDQAKTGQLQESLKTEAQDALEKEGVSADVEVVGVGLQRVQEAQNMGVTPGKLNLVEKLQASSGDPGSIDLQEWLNKPVRDIMKQIDENKGNEDHAGGGGNGTVTAPSPEPSGQPSAAGTQGSSPDQSEKNNRKEGQNTPAATDNHGKEKDNPGNEQAAATATPQAQGTADQAQGNNGGSDKENGGGKNRGNGNSSDNSNGKGNGKDKKN